MSTDFVVNWGTKRPTGSQIQTVIEDFFNGGESIVTIVREKRWWTVTMPGRTSHPLARISPLLKKSPMEPRDRGLEVYLSSESLSVITRLQDEYVNSLAKGLAEVFVRYWEARKGWE